MPMIEPNTTTLDTDETLEINLLSVKSIMVWSDKDMTFKNPNSLGLTWPKNIPLEIDEIDGSYADQEDDKLVFVATDDDQVINWIIQYWPEETRPARGK